MTSEYKGLERFKDNSDKIVELLEELVSETKLNNALLRRLNHDENDGLPRQVKKDMILHELLNGRLIKARDIMRMLKVSKPTAITYMTEIANDNKYILKDCKGNRGLILTKKVNQ